VDFVAVVDQVTTLLRQRGRAAYRTLKRQFQLDDEAVEDLKIELIESQRLAMDAQGPRWSGPVQFGHSCQLWGREDSFADRSGLVEVHVAHATAGEALRPQLDGVRRQVRIDSAAVEVRGELHLQPSLF
jgi:hypothetical protein